jgi:hypothetical protein
LAPANALFELWREAGNRKTTLVLTAENGYESRALRAAAMRWSASCTARTSLICFRAKPLFLAISSKSFAVESLSFPSGRVSATHTDDRGRIQIVPVLCNELRLEVLPGRLAFVDGLLINVLR